MQTAEAITTDTVALAVQRGLRRRYGELKHAVKLMAEAFGYRFDPRTIEGWWNGKNPPQSAALVQLMKDVDEVDEEIRRLSGRVTEADIARLRAGLRDLERTIDRLSGAPR